MPIQEKEMFERFESAMLLTYFDNKCVNWQWTSNVLKDIVSKNTQKLFY